MAVLAKFFGFVDAVFPNVLPPLLPGPDSVAFDLGGHEQAQADAMNRVLWPVLFGYYIQNFVNVTQTGQAATTKIDHDQARSYFKRNVRARGPAPAFRVGLVPYGLLPVVSISKWQAMGAAADDQLEIRMIDVLRRLAELWKRASGKVARVKPGIADGLPDLLKALSLAPSAREMRIREVLGSDAAVQPRSVLADRVLNDLQRHLERGEQRLPARRPRVVDRLGARGPAAQRAVQSDSDRLRRRAGADLRGAVAPVGDQLRRFDAAQPDAAAPR